MAETETTSAAPPASTTATVPSGSVPTTAPSAPAPPVTEGWRTTLPAEIREHPVLARYQDVGAAAKALVEADKHIRSTRELSLPAPGPDGKLSAESKQAWLDKVRAAAPGLLPEGAPPSADTYEFQWPLIDGMTPEMRQQTEADYRAIAHRMGLSPAQAQGLLQWYGERTQRQLDGLEGLYEQGMTALRQQWGPTTDARLGRVQRMLDEHDPEGHVKRLLKAAHLDNSPEISVFLSTLTEHLYERGGIDFSREFRLPTVEDTNAQLDEMLRDRQGPYWNPMHPEHQAAVARFAALGQQAERQQRQQR
jgi:hypothetical protein